MDVEQARGSGGAFDHAASLLQDSLNVTTFSILQRERALDGVNRIRWCDGGNRKQVAAQDQQRSR
jgi:hypothetical protein